MKPGREYPEDRKPGAYRVVGKSYTYLGGEWRSGRISFQTRELGDFTLLVDSIPPTIRPQSINSQTVRFKISDELSRISSYEATIDGNWLLMHYDSKTGTLRSERLNKSEPLKGELQLIVTDYAGNKQVDKQAIP